MKSNKSLIANFFLPHRFDSGKKISNLRITAIIPTFKPSNLTVNLIRSILKWNSNVSIIVVDDSTPLGYEAKTNIFKTIAEISSNIKILRTPTNKLKAGAINYGLKEIFKQKNLIPQVIITLDDDVVISNNTIRNLAENLFEDERLGAVCSQCGVINKNKNFLTRLQGLEYLGFNGARLADQGFFNGPLVMHGMLTAFRTAALEGVGLFAEKHLIEDYEITARLKKYDWHVRLAPHAYAWTKVPETWLELWRQRTRWTVGGLFVVGEAKNWRVVVQDVIGHSLFLILLMLIIISFIFVGEPGSIKEVIPVSILALSFIQVLIWYAFQIWIMRYYAQKDWKDWLIRATLIPEFLYANLLTLVLVGSYVFYFFHVVFFWEQRKNIILEYLKKFTKKIFAKIGYTSSWGTRQEE